MKNLIKYLITVLVLVILTACGDKGFNGLEVNFEDSRPQWELILDERTLNQETDKDAFPHEPLSISLSDTYNNIQVHLTSVVKSYRLNTVNYDLPENTVEEFGVPNSTYCFAELYSEKLDEDYEYYTSFNGTSETISAAELHRSPESHFTADVDGGINYHPTLRVEPSKHLNTTGDTLILEYEYNPVASRQPGFGLVGENQELVIDALEHTEPRPLSQISVECASLDSNGLPTETSRYPIEKTYLKESIEYTGEVYVKQSNQGE